MGRQPRLIADGLVYHALNRGNNRNAVFRNAADYGAFVRALTQTKERYPFRLYAYCLMNNHFHLVVEPGPGQSISRIMQALTVTHTWYYHKSRNSSGHVWQGRFKSPVIQTDSHLLTVMRYVESNPTRAGLTGDLARYPWSSYQVHGLGEESTLVDEAPVWSGLAKTEAGRQAYWRRRTRAALTEKELALVRRAVTTGRPFGTDAWVGEIAAKLGVDLTPRPRGRPPKARIKSTDTG